jgi:riboflavin kinase/FMN adenylyltransferase
MDGVANFGHRPTFDKTDELLEVHLLDADEDLYGRHLRVALVAHIRSERRFDGLDALKAQIADDAAQARALLARRHFPTDPGPVVPLSEPAGPTR